MLIVDGGLTDAVVMNTMRDQIKITMGSSNKQG